MRRATITLAILAFAALLTACNLWPILLDQQPAGNAPGRVMITDPTPSRESLPETNGTNTRTQATPRADGFGQAAGETERTSTIPPPPPVLTMTAQALGPTLTPPGTPDFYTPVGGCTPPPSAPDGCS